MLLTQFVKQTPSGVCRSAAYQLHSLSFFVWPTKLLSLNLPEQLLHIFSFGWLTEIFLRISHLINNRKKWPVLIWNPGWSFLFFGHIFLLLDFFGRLIHGLIISKSGSLCVKSGDVFQLDFLLFIITVACLQLQSSQSKHFLLCSDVRLYTGADLCFSVVTLCRWPKTSTNASHLSSICTLTPTVEWKNSSIQLLTLRSVSGDLHCIITAEQRAGLIALQEHYTSNQTRNVCTDFSPSEWPLSLFVLKLSV